MKISDNPINGNPYSLSIKYQLFEGKACDKRKGILTGKLYKSSRLNLNSIREFSLEK